MTQHYEKMKAVSNSIWDTYQELYPIPEGMIDCTYGNDSGPSYSSQDGTVQVWFVDEEDLPVHGDGTRFIVERSLNGEEVYGMSEGYGDPMTVTRFQTWAGTLRYLDYIIHGGTIGMMAEISERRQELTQELAVLWGKLQPEQEDMMNTIIEKLAKENSSPLSLSVDDLACAESAWAIEVRHLEDSNVASLYSSNHKEELP